MQPSREKKETRLQATRPTARRNKRGTYSYEALLGCPQLGPDSSRASRWVRFADSRQAASCQPWPSSVLNHPPDHTSLRCLDRDLLYSALEVGPAPTPVIEQKPSQ